MNLIRKTLRYFFKIFLLGSLFFIKGESEFKTKNMEEKIEIVNGLKVNYRIAGNGPALLLLHGYTLSGKLWDPFIEKFSQHFTVIVPDLPGHGLSDEVEGKNTASKFANVMIDFLQKIGVNEVHTVGHSGGGMTILNMVKNKPDLVKSMVLIGITHKFSKEGIEFTKQDTFESLSEKVKEFYRELHPQGDRQTKKLYDEILHMLFEYNNFEILADEFEKIPALIIMGDRDIYFKPEFAVEMYNALPHSQLWIIPGQKHLPFREDWGGSKEVEKIFTDVIKNFIKSN